MNKLILIVVMVLSFSTVAKARELWFGLHECYASGCVDQWGNQKQPRSYYNWGPCPTSDDFQDYPAPALNHVHCSHVVEKMFQDPIKSESNNEIGYVYYNQENHSIQAVNGSSSVTCYENVTSFENLVLTSRNAIAKSDMTTGDQCSHSATGNTETFSRNGISVIFEAP